MSDVELIDLTKHYRQGKTLVRALDSVSIRIRAGELVSIVGRSGSGKTTLLDLVGLLLRPTEGTVRIGGINTGDLGDKGRSRLRNREVGFIFQEYNLLPALNAVENIMLPLRYSRNRVKGSRERGLRLVEMVGLSGRIGHRPDELSGGEQQRVAIARALINGPSLVLADEPTGAVDTQTAHELIGLMQKLNREEKVTFVIVTHDLEVAAQTDRVIRLKDGRVIADEAPTRPTELEGGGSSGKGLGRKE